MMADAEAHASEDAKKKELIEVRNMAEALSYSTEKALKEAGDKISAEIKSDIEAKLEVLKKLKDSDSITDIKTATEELSKSAQKIGEAIYKAQQAQNPQEPKVETEPHEEKPEEKKE